VVLLDVGLQDKNSLRLAETVKNEMAESRVIVMDLLPVHEEILCSTSKDRRTSGVRNRNPCACSHHACRLARRNNVTSTPLQR
jgi:hypothetical protein